MSMLDWLWMGLALLALLIAAVWVLGHLASKGMAWEWPDARGYIGLGSFLLVLVVLAAIIADKSLLESDAFLILATAIIITGWVQGPVGWAYQATKQGGEMAERNQGLVESQLPLVPQLPAPARQLPQEPPAGDPEPDVILQPGETAQAAEPLPTRPAQPGE